MAKNTVSPSRTRRDQYKARLVKQSNAGDVGATAEFYFALMRDNLLTGDFCPYYWASTASRRSANCVGWSGRKPCSAM